jgi:ABC-type glycerol-3-phosphate transport system substrate-binding protein
MSIVDGQEIFFRRLFMKGMKRIFLAILALFAAAGTVFAAGGQAGSSGTGGLTTLKVFGIDKQYTVAGQNLQLSDWYKGKIKSRIWDQFTADLAKRGIRLELELVMLDQINTVFQTMLAAGKLNDYDFVSAGSNIDAKTRIGLVNQGRLYPINKLLTEYSDGTARNFYTTDIGKTYAKLSTLQDGNFYWLTNSTATYYKNPTNYKGSMSSGMIRKDWLDAAGLGMPKTLDEFYNALSAFQQKDVNGNGMKDEVAAVSMDGFGTGIAQWFGLASGWSGFVSSIDYKVISPWYQNHVKDYFTFMNRLYKAGLLRTTSEGNDMAANRIAYQFGWSLETWDEPGVAVQQGAAKAYYVPFVLQAAADTQPRVWAQEGIGLSFGVHFVPARAKNLAGVGKLLDYLVTKDYATLTEQGIEGYTFQYDSQNNFQAIPRNSNSIGLDNDLTNARLPALWTNNSILPRFERFDRVSEMSTAIETGRNLGYPQTGFQLKVDFFTPHHEGAGYAYIQDLDAITAYPTVAEIDRLAALRPDLETYSKELCTALIMGEKSLANWDSYIADLKRLGLDEFISIYQAQVDRGRR